jgi:hypothetical protein
MSKDSGPSDNQVKRQAFRVLVSLPHHCQNKGKDFPEALENSCF